MNDNTISHFPAFSERQRKTKSENKYIHKIKLFLFTVFWRLYCMSVTDMSKIKELKYSQAMKIQNKTVILYEHHTAFESVIF